MSRFKKLIATVITFAMVFGVVGALPAMTAKAATGGGFETSFNVETNELTVVISEPAENGIAYISMGELKGTATEPKEYATYEYTLSGKDSDEAVFDLSSYAKKGVKLSIHIGDKTKAETVEIKKHDYKLKAVLDFDAKDADTDISKIFSVTNRGTALATGDVVQFRIEGDTWAELNAANIAKVLPKIEQFGTTVYFRVLGSKDDKGVITLSTPEAKLKYPKMGKVPKVTVDYVKDSVKFPKNVLVKGVNSEPDGTEVKPAAASWLALKTAEDKGVVEINKLPLAATTEGAAFDFYVRTAASGKKPSSAVALVSVIKANGTVLAATDSSIKFSEDAKTFTNKTDVTIEYKTTSDGKWLKVVKDGTSKSVGTATKIWVRVAGVKEATGVDAVRASKVAEIDVPAASTGEPEVVEVTGVTVTGDATIGSTLTATVAPATATDVTYQWYATLDTVENGAAISGATSKTFEIETAQAGKKLYVKVSGAKSSEAVSELTATVTAGA